MKKILCFGDSNTFGYIPGFGGRYKETERWSGILKDKCNNAYIVVEQGCNDRTCFSENPRGDEFCGFKVIQNYIDNDTEVIILAIGINDIQLFYNPSLEDIKSGIKNMINLCKNKNSEAKIIIVCPPEISKDVLAGEFSYQFNEDSIEKSKKLPEIYKSAAIESGCIFVDLNDIIKVSNKDGLHYEPSEHRKIAEKLYEIINNDL